MPGCRWKEAWRSEFLWIAPVEGKPDKVTCTACDKELSCDHGAYDLKKHENRGPHIANVGKKKDAEITVRSQSIMESFKKAEAKTSELRKVKDAALKAEVMISNLIATHNLLEIYMIQAVGSLFVFC